VRRILRGAREQAETREQPNHCVSHHVGPTLEPPESRQTKPLDLEREVPIEPRRIASNPGLACHRARRVSYRRAMIARARKAGRQPRQKPPPKLSFEEALREIYAVVRAIPRGCVATYGQIGELAGIPAGHRVVARAMRGCPPKLPWHRVVGKQDARRARIAVQDPDHVRTQRKLLEREGVRFDPNGFIRLADAGWLPTQR
jgi:methylated-DNA-protein-cysteine methyltransferase-like protein